MKVYGEQEAEAIREFVKDAIVGVDLDGTGLDNNGAFPGLDNALHSMEKMGARIAFVTNVTTKHPERLAEIVRAGGYDARRENIISAGDSAIGYLKRNQPDAKVIVEGTSDMLKQVEESGLPIDWENPNASIHAFNRVGDDLVYSGRFYNEIYHNIDNPEFTMLATHSNPNLPLGRDHKGRVFMGPDTGILLRGDKSAIGYNPLDCGKPGEIMAEEIQTRLQVTRDDMKKRFFMIGDGTSDLLTGNNFGKGSLHVETGGNTADDMRKKGVHLTFALNHIADLAHILR